MALKKLCQHASDLSLWANTIWTHLENAESQDVKELQNKIAAKIYSLISQRKVYYTYYGKETYFDVPVIENVKEIRSDLRYYDSLLNSVKNQSAVTEDLILAVLLEQVSRSVALREETPENEHLIVPEEAADISEYFGKAIKKLSITMDASKDKVELATPKKSLYLIFINYLEIS